MNARSLLLAAALLAPAAAHAEGESNNLAAVELPATMGLQQTDLTPSLGLGSAVAAQSYRPMDMTGWPNQPYNPAPKQ